MYLQAIKRDTRHGWKVIETKAQVPIPQYCDHILLARFSANWRKGLKEKEKEKELETKNSKV